MTIARKNWDANISGETYDEDRLHYNDIWLENGTFAMCEGKDEYAQTIEAVIKTVQGEIQVDIQYGIPYFTTIFNTIRAETMWAAAVREAVKALDFVQDIQDFTYSYDSTTHHFNYELTVKTIDNEMVTVSD